MDEFSAYVAGFFDGEGWLVIGRERKEGRSDLHRIGVYITQRARHREVLDRIQARFGGTVSVRDTKLKDRVRWAEQADWHIHTREQIERFCLAVQSHCIVKAPQIAIALEYVQGFHVDAPVRDALGRIHGGKVTQVEVERRESLRMRLREANARGPDRLVKIERQPLDVQRVDREAVTPTTNLATVSRGEHRYNARLNDDAVRSIRSEYAAGMATQESLATRYGVSPAAIRQVILRLSWAHVT